MESVNFQKIMIATDGSDCSMLAAGKGIELARLSGGNVYAVYVVSTNYSPSVGVDFYWGEIYEAFKKDGENAVNNIKEMGERVGVNVEPILLDGHPADELIRYAEEEEMDIVIMGTIGKTGLNKLLLGSVTGSLVRHSRVPVMVAREKM